ncbi:MAG: metalloregulator ArsR/SmtB family transcription factor [Myxococcales bacterium]|nr:metalloregulator ArsR/SmtB family transcription factor [Myxococcales bacterium]
MHAFDVLGDPVRRRLLEALAHDERSSGELVAEVKRDFSISQSGVSQHLRILRESGFATVRVDGARRMYSIDTAGLRHVDHWLGQFRGLWERRLDALDAEVARGKRVRKKRRLRKQRGGAK